MTSSTGNILAKQVAVDEFITSVKEYATNTYGPGAEITVLIGGFLDMVKIGHFATMGMAERLEQLQREHPEMF